MLKSIMTLASSTVISQIILILFTPILSRLFSIEDFGILSIFTSISVFLVAVSAGKYELAIGLPKHDLHAKIIYNLIIHLSLFFAFCYFLITHIAVYFFNIKHVYYLLPCYVVLVALYSAQTYMYQRVKKYKHISIALLIQSCINVFASLVFGYLNVNNGLIYALLCGFLGSNLYLTMKNTELLKIKNLSKKTIVIARKYKHFPKYMILSDLSLLMTQYSLPILLGLVYNSTIVGLFAMANRVIRIPNIVITGSISNVFRNEAIDIVRKTGNCYDLYVKTLKKLTIFSISIYLVLFFILPLLFPIFLGEQWKESGYFAQILVILLMVEFVAIPLNNIFVIMNKQKQLMNIRIFMGIVSMVFVYLISIIYHNPYLSLIALVVVSTLFNIIQLMYSYRYSKGNLYAT